MRVLPNRYAIETIRQVSLTKKLFYFNLKSFAQLSCVFTQLEIVFNRSLKIPDFLNYVSEIFTVNHNLLSIISRNVLQVGSDLLKASFNQLSTSGLTRPIESVLNIFLFQSHLLQPFYLIFWGKKEKHLVTLKLVFSKNVRLSNCYGVSYNH